MVFSEDTVMEDYPNMGSKECEINLRPCNQTRKLLKAKVTSELFQCLKISRFPSYFFMIVFLKKICWEKNCFKTYEKSQLNLRYI